MIRVGDDHRAVGEPDFEARSIGERRRRGEDDRRKPALVEDEIAGLEIRHRPPAL
jgi:hypothetical protein